MHTATLMHSLARPCTRSRRTPANPNSGPFTKKKSPWVYAIANSTNPRAKSTDTTVARMMSGLISGPLSA